MSADELEKRNIRFSNGLLIAKHNLAGFLIGLVMGAVLAVLSYIGGFNGMSLEASGLVGVGGTLVISLLLLPLVQLKAGILGRKEKIEYVLTVLLVVIVAWPMFYAVLVGPVSYSR